MRSLKYFFSHPKEVFISFLKNYGGFIPDKIYLEWQYRLILNKRLNLKNPLTFNEKIQWLKLNDRNHKHTTMVDKLAVKRYVKSLIGDDYIIPTIGFWDRIEDIEWESLPNQFVLKTTHGGGGTGVVVVKDKQNADKEKIINQLNWSLKDKGYTRNREWPYKNVTRKIFAEVYMEDENSELRDYKFFCFDGEPKFLFMASGRMGHDTLTFDFLDMDYNRFPVKNGHPNSKTIPQKPQNFDEMVKVARKLAQGETFVRVDLYNIRGKIYFGEYTFFHNSGFVAFDPDEWDMKFGSFINLKKN